MVFSLTWISSCRASCLRYSAFSSLCAWAKVSFNLGEGEEHEESSFALHPFFQGAQGDAWVASQVDSALPLSCFSRQCSLAGGHSQAYGTYFLGVVVHICSLSTQGMGYDLKATLGYIGSLRLTQTIYRGLVSKRELGNVAQW